MAFGEPVAHRLVPSSGSTAMSTSGSSSRQVPTRSPMYSIGASSRSPSPITTVPRMRSVSIALRMASTATPSECLRSPWPIVRAQATAASSTTRRNSRDSSCLQTHGCDPLLGRGVVSRPAGGAQSESRTRVEERVRAWARGRVVCGRVDVWTCDVRTCGRVGVGARVHISTRPYVRTPAHPDTRHVHTSTRPHVRVTRAP